MSNELDQLIEEHGELVRRIAFSIGKRIPPSIAIDDLMQSGMEGLILAHQRYDPSLGASFETYAGIRIRGQMLDELRRSDWAPRSVHRKVRAFDEALSRIEQRGGSTALSEIANEAGYSLKDLAMAVSDSAATRICSLDDLLTDKGENDKGSWQPSSHDPSPLENIEMFTIRVELRACIECLKPRLRTIFDLLCDDYTLKQIGEILDVSESRVCQLRGEIIAKVRRHFEIIERESVLREID